MKDLLIISYCNCGLNLLRCNCFLEDLVHKYVNMNIFSDLRFCIDLFSVESCLGINVEDSVKLPDSTGHS